MERCGPKQWARLRILQACERLKIPVEIWPKFPLPELPRPYCHFYRASEPLKLPHFLPLQESEADWKTRVQSRLDELVEQELARFRRQLERDLRSGFLTPIKQTRDTTPIELRYDWTAKRICYRTPFPELARTEGKGYTMERIKRAVNLIITEAGLRKGS